MSEHGWPDGHDDGDHGYDDGYADPVLPGGDDVPPPLDDGTDLWHHDDAFDAAGEAPTPDLPAEEPGAPLPDAGPEPGPDLPPVAVTDDMGPVGADPDAVADAGDEPVFPPAVDVGPLPEPVDGFPWIDTSSLGLAAAGPLPVPDEPVDPRELAAYAAADLPPGVDPWAELAGSDDPATGALARWWSEHGH
jgi:hypothetical protein